MNGDWLGLSGIVCAVTGAGSGIGRAVAGALAEAGALLTLLDRNEAGLAETAGAIPGALALPCDVADPGSVAAAATASAAVHGACTVLVNNAGILRPGALETVEPDQWNALLAVNLTGYLLCARAFGAQMRAEGGAVVHVASIAGQFPLSLGGAYSVANAGIAMLSRQLATEWGQAGIRSNVVSPGMVQTPLSQSFYADPAVIAARSAAIPAGRIGRVEDVANAVLFLASPRAAYITGAELTVDGGFTHNIMRLIPRPSTDPLAGQ